MCFIIGSFWMSGVWLSHYNINVKTWRLRLIRAALSVILLFLCLRQRMTALVGLHLLVIFALTEFIAAIFRRAAGKYRMCQWYGAFSKIYRSCLIPAAVTAAFIGWGAYNMSHIVETDYTIVSDKLNSDYKVVFLSDTHYDTVQNPDVLKATIDKINALSPDAVILGGDIVEENTSKAAMQECFAVLGQLRSTYGTYYIYGNHDRQPYVQTPAYTEDELAAGIEENGIKILRDTVITLGNDIVLAGREDAGSRTGRMNGKDLLDGVSREKFIIVADHQPVETEENGRLGVNLQLSGHTHAGQIFPVGIFNHIIDGINYGRYDKNGCEVIVSSGAAGWGFPVKTEGKSEYVVVNLRAE